MEYNWKIDKALVDEQRSRLDVYFAHSGGASASPEMGLHFDHRSERTCHHLDLLEFKRFIHRQVPRIRPFAGVKTLKVPGTGATNRFPHVFERWATNLLNVTKTAKLLRIGFDVINWILHQSMLRRQQRRSLERIQHFRVDDKAIRRGDTYATVVSATERATMLDPDEGRD